MKTEKQRKRERKHALLVSEFRRLDAEGGSREAIYQALERKYGYGARYIRMVLAKNGITLKPNRDNERDNSKETATAQLQGHQRP